MNPSAENTPSSLPSRKLLSLAELVHPFSSGDQAAQMEVLTAHCSSLPGKTNDLGAQVAGILNARPRLAADTDFVSCTLLRVLSPFAPASAPAIVAMLGRPEMESEPLLARELLSALESYAGHAPGSLIGQAAALGGLLDSSSGRADDAKIVFCALCAIGPHAASQVGTILRLFQAEKISEEQLQKFVGVLGGTADERLAEALADLGEDDYGTRYERGLTMACGQLSAIGIARLGELLETDECGALRRVLYALRSYGPHPGMELENAQAREYLPRITELLRHETYPVPLFAIETLERLARREDVEALGGLVDVLKMKAEEESAEMVLNLKQAASKALFLIYNRP